MSTPHIHEAVPIVGAYVAKGSVGPDLTHAIALPTGATPDGHINSSVAFGNVRQHTFSAFFFPAVVFSSLAGRQVAGVFASPTPGEAVRHPPPRIWNNRQDFRQVGLTCTLDHLLHCASSVTSAVLSPVFMNACTRRKILLVTSW